jgi:hypothetical protein
MYSREVSIVEVARSIPLNCSISHITEQGAEVRTNRSENKRRIFATV